LNQKEFDSIPRSARPRVGSLPGAVESRASINQKTFLSGFRYQFKINERWSDETSLYGAFTRLRNPGIFNYSWVNEAHTGGRTQMTYKNERVTFITGMEIQQGFTTAKAFKNVKGSPDSLRTDDEVNHFLMIGFTQLSWKLKGNWILDGGISINQLTSSLTRLSNVPVITNKRTYSNQWAPRLALLKKMNSHISVYASIARGFSPPTTSELLPSSGIVSTDLNAESGLNWEAGSRGMIRRNRLSYDISIFRFQLKDAIVLRRDALGRDYFVNAGSTQQSGVEMRIDYRVRSEHFVLPGSRIWTSYTGYQFRYKEFKKATTDFSGKQLPSVPKHTFLSGIDLMIRGGWYGNITHTYTGKIPLNDANTDWSRPYHFISLRAGWKKQVGQSFQIDLYLSGDNLTDTRYSLGYDLNAIGGRYFNTAPERNWTVGCMISFDK
jgi:iron complex outermembrane receptor protein